MKRQLGALGAVIIFGTLHGGYAAAQSTPSTTQPTTGSSPTAMKADATGAKTITVVGCLQQAGMASTGSTTAGSSSTAGAPAQGFVLTNARVSESSTAGAAADTGAAASSAAGASASRPTLGTNARVRLMPGSLEQSELQKHLNHQIEVQGQLTMNEKGAATSGSSATSSSSTSPSGSTGTGGSATGSSTMASGGTAMAEAATMRASSIRMLSATCSAQ
jgi:hypothetical protein